MQTARFAHQICSARQERKYYIPRSALSDGVRWVHQGVKYVFHLCMQVLYRTYASAHAHHVTCMHMLAYEKLSQMNACRLAYKHS